MALFRAARDAGQTRNTEVALPRIAAVQNDTHSNGEYEICSVLNSNRKIYKIFCRATSRRQWISCSRSFSGNAPSWIRPSARAAATRALSRNALHANSWAVLKYIIIQNHVIDYLFVRRRPTVVGAVKSFTGLFTSAGVLNWSSNMKKCWGSRHKKKLLSRRSKALCLPLKG